MRIRPAGARAGPLPLAAWLACLALVSGAAQPSTFILVSSPARQLVFYAKVPSAAKAAMGELLQAKTLTISGQLQMPYGIAVDGARAIVYVADQAQNAVMAMRLAIQFDDDGNENLVIVDVPKAAVEGVRPKYIAVDGTGNLFMAQDTGEILTVPGDELAEAVRAGTAVSKVTTLYTSDQVLTMKKPQGVAVDNFNVYWANGEGGTQAGTVMAAFEVPPDAGSENMVEALTTQVDSAFGVCLSGKYLFFTGAQERVYGMRQKGGATQVITKQLQTPRGCAWDGDGTIYVADKGASSVYAFSANAPSLRAMMIQEVLKVPGAYDVGIFTTSGAAAGLRAWVAMAVLALTTTLVW